MFDLFHKSYLVRDIEKTYDLFEIKNKLVNDFNRNIKKTNPKIILQMSMGMRCIEDSLGSCLGLSLDS